LGAGALEGWPALFGALLVQEGGLWLARRLSPPCHRSLASSLYLAAYGLRVAIVLPTHYVAKLGDGNGALYRDDYTNDLVGEWLVRIARGDAATSIFPGHQYLLSSVYSYLLMGIYTVFGYAPLLPKLLNVGLAGLCAVLTFELARTLFSHRAAVLAALGTAFLPSLIVWSVATLKETLVLFTALVALWAIQFLAGSSTRDRRLMNALVLLFGLVMLLLDLRPPTAFIMIGLVGVLAVGRAHVRLRPWQMGLGMVVVSALLISGVVVIRVRTSSRPLTATFEDVALQIRHRRAQEAAGATSQLRSENDVLSASGSELPVAEQISDAQPFSLIGDVIDPLGYALLAPTPWQAQSSTELAASLEMPVWYVLLVGSMLAWRASSGQRVVLLMLIVYGVANWLILAAVEGNVGNLLRHRLMLDPVLLMLGAAGLEWAWLHVARPVDCHV
jgi:hypothetical protein